MQHPDIDLDDIAKKMIDLGFTQTSKTCFDRDFLNVTIKDSILPGWAALICKPFFVVKIYSPGNELIMQFTCQIDDFETFKNTQG